MALRTVLGCIKIEFPRHSIEFLSLVCINFSNQRKYWNTSINVLKLLPKKKGNFRIYLLFAKMRKWKNSPNFSNVLLKDRTHLENLQLLQIQVESRFNIHIKIQFYRKPFPHPGWPPRVCLLCWWGYKAFFEMGNSSYHIFMLQQRIGW